MRIVSSFGAAGIYPLSRVEKFQHDDILYIYDVYDDQLLDQLIGTKGNPAAVINDSFTFIENSRPFPVYCADLWLEQEVQRYQQLQMVERPYTEYSANFIINKKQVNRYLAIKLVEYFDIPVEYTWSGTGKTFDMSDVISDWTNVSFDDIPEPARRHLLEPIELSPKWIDYQNDTHNGYNIVPYGGNVWTWNNGIQDIVTRSAVSIITESVWNQRAMHFSEKTLYSVLGLTFPLWVGGYRQADEWKSLGFDIFDDIINHDYQYHQTLIERCWWAIAYNVNLLRDTDLLRQLRKQHLGRLLRNRDSILSNSLRSHNDRVIAHWPPEIQHDVPAILSIFR